MSHLMTKPTKWCVRPAKTQISLGIFPVWTVFAVRSMGSWGPNVSSCGQRRLIRLGRCPCWSESSLGAQVLLKVCHKADHNRYYMSQSMTKPTQSLVCPAKIQISLGMCPVQSVFTVCFISNHLQADRDDSGQTRQMSRPGCRSFCRFFHAPAPILLSRQRLTKVRADLLVCLFELEFYGPVNNVVMSSRSVNSGNVPVQAKTFLAVNQY